MANYKSVEVTAADASPGEKMMNIGHIKSAEFSYVTLGSEAATEYIEAVRIPVGSQVVGYTVVTTGTFGTGAALGIGVTAGGVEVVASIDVAADGTDTAFVVPTTASAGSVWIEFVDVGDGNASDTIDGCIYYI